MEEFSSKAGFTIRLELAYSPWLTQMNERNNIGIDFGEKKILEEDKKHDVDMTA